MNPENRGQETTGPVYAPTPLRTTWSVDLGNGLNGTFVHSNINGTTRLLVPEVRSAAAPATTSPTAPPTTGSPTAPASQDQYEQSAIDLITLLYSCSTAVAKGDKELVNVGLEMICSGLASDDVGWPIHRLASSFADALALRMVQPWQGVCRALQLQKTTPAPATAAACRHFVEMCLFLRLTRTTANYGIIDATRTERNVVLHVVDLGGADPDQWLLLLRLFAKRPGREDEFLSVTGALLAREAESLHIGFHFHPVKLQINQLLSIEPLGVRSGETLVIVSTLQLHRLLADEFVEVAARPHDRKGKAQAHATMMRADALLRDLAKLSPKLMVVTEPEVNHNGEFTARFENALNYYGALFDALEESVPTRGSAMERADVERCLLLQEIRDIVPYDGAQRRERHERMGSGRDG
ncbi:scarecrow-like protein 3 [Aegilops tauschii subsp. strangulata]|uniref:scarecrow-like protein 3 n=1 Tax=Aegilops tauschii subsp. strangulata TaxID=200361 RepID=UPI003CC8603F